MCRASLGAAALLVIASTAFANGAEVTGSDAGTIIPLESTDIRLLSEDLNIYLSLTNGSDEGAVSCEYILQNLTSRPRTVSMAFVTTSSNLVAWNEFSVFQGVSESRVPIRMVAANKEKWKSIAQSLPDSLPVWDLSFKPDEAIRIRIGYGVCWTDLGDPRGLQFTYNARPAALWAGSILTATISFTLGPIVAQLLECQMNNECLRVSIEPRDYKVDSEGLIWRYADWEPTQDIRVTLEWPNESDEH